MKSDCVVFFDFTRSAWILVSRPAYLEYVLNYRQYLYIKLIYLSDKKPNKTLTILLGKLGLKIENKTARQLFVIRPKGKTKVLKTTWALTNSCPYVCKICIMRGIAEKEMTTAEKKRALYRLYELGCVWLSFTGGEPLAAKDFCEIYELAYSLGFLIKIQTNGFYISENQKIQILLQNKPPYQITLSMYGANASTYDEYTGVKGSFHGFYLALILLRRLDIQIKINIIITKDNERECQAMVGLCKDFEFEYLVGANIMPTFSGNASPVDCMVECPNKYHELNPLPPPSLDQSQDIDCQAGKNFIHITSSGQVLPCQTARVTCRGFNLFTPMILWECRMKKEIFIIKKIPDECESCACQICIPNRLLYFKAGLIPNKCTKEVP